MKSSDPADFPFASLLGLKPKRKKLTPEQEAGQALLDLAAKFSPTLYDKKN